MGFGWDYPPGCSGPPEGDTECAKCGAETNYDDECVAEVEDDDGTMTICTHVNLSPYEQRRLEQENRY